jgi:membrane protein
VTSVAGGVTFFALLALFPAITALVSIYGTLADPTTIADTLSMLDQFLPEGAIELIAGQVIAIASAPSSTLSIAGIVSILVALWSANGGMKALIEALNIAWFETEKRSFIMLNLVSLGMTLAAIVGVIFMIALVAVLPILLNTVLAGSRVEWLLNWLRWPLLAGMLIVGLAFIYRFGPSKEDPKWQWVSPGALVATVGLLVASALFSWYAANLANYNQTYGSLGAAIATMIWLWIAAIVVLTGGEINSEVERQIKIENGVEPKSREDLDHK